MGFKMNPSKPLAMQGDKQQLADLSFHLNVQNTLINYKIQRKDLNFIIAQNSLTVSENLRSILTKS
jgi:hypothetical protein